MTTTAYQARQALLSRAEDIITTYVDVALGTVENYQGDSEALKEVFRKVVPMIRTQDDRTQFTAFQEEGTTEERIEGIFHSVGSGKLSLKDGLLALDLLTAGLNASESIELREALKRLGA